MLTKQRDLRTGRSVWQGERPPRFPKQDITADTESDVVIIGAGISGAMQADMLSEAGFSVLVVDRRGPVRGSTPASTALLQFEVDQPLIKLTRQIGEEAAIRAWRRSRLAVDGLGARIRALSIAPVIRRDSLYLAGDVLDAEGLGREHEARRRAGLETALLDAAALKEDFGIDRDAALLGYDNLEADPVVLATGFLRAAVARGARIAWPVEIVDLDASPRSVSLRTKDGHRIRCRHLIFCTGYELPFGEMPKGHGVLSTWALATAPQKGSLWPRCCFIWEASDPYLYLRTTRDGRIICGGEDEDFVDEDKRDALLGQKVAALQRKLGKLLPEVSTEADYSWTGTFGASTTGLPTIGPMPGLKNCWTVMGFGGNGITYSRVGAEIVRAGLTGKGDPDAELYAFRS
ncbi:Glycine/D-amino acid oxidase [Bosea sp. 62]|uniref:NAD(P)/FAD-dependent oxidoreductase n=1 Tax=unclassified Bosea (in: a-proteobacteria) TaxID=2653178 RepID=UPI001258CFE4|nr:MULTISPECIES: FAD-binding oxidoreductase [unclassified Bosea (in: a-proteobacteria)]CAD5248315.1 Glycine/D-amino acid oxidase [Bosea sp. 46]CAD5249658.1 Glycine/D-amino acid oxidase [Bosea sp. 21B]CAD5266412.1 Glycine/D-amino acid oxidase [Bosea sp. 7B]VVT44889.1 Glycine/D-amino acid oxidase [Bosea sp. EC-HK365B]VXB02491.1 Glycine/D-amino acid oxidase [Bosea sp. 29B]